MRVHPGKIAAAFCLLLPSLASATGPQLSIQQVVLGQKDWPHAKAYVSVVGASGAPIQGLSQDLFKVYEGGNKDSSKVEKVDSLAAARAGAAIVIVVQASGAMMGIEEDLKKAVAAFVNGLGDRDQVALVAYGDGAQTVSPLSGAKGEVAVKASSIAFNGRSFLLYEGLDAALKLLSPSSGGGMDVLPPAKAIIAISDGRDNGSTSDLEKIIAEAARRHIPIDAIGHSEVDQDSLTTLEQIARRTGGIYKAAPAVEDIGRALADVKDSIDNVYVVQFKTRLAHDGKEHKIEVAMENEAGAMLKSSMMVKTPDFFDWTVSLLVGCGLLLFTVMGAAVYLFWFKPAKARLTVQKGPATGKTYPLAGKVVSLGSGPENDVRILDGAVSGRHAGLAIDGGKFEIVDLNSKNGVLVNGKKTARSFLRDGDIITLGLTEFKFESTIAHPEPKE